MSQQKDRLNLTELLCIVHILINTNKMASSCQRW